MPTKDIEIDHPSHIFYANGIATSNSHSVSYGMVGYWTAYVKTHFPLHFFTSWLYYAKEKIKPYQEIRRLFINAKSYGIDLFTPSVHTIDKNNHDVCIDNNNIHFGMMNIKRLGLPTVEKMLVEIAKVEQTLKKDMPDFSWLEFLIYVTPKVSLTAVNNLISGGVLDHFKIGRQYMLFQYQQFAQLTPREQNLCQQQYSAEKPLTDIIDAVIDSVNINRKKILGSIVLMLHNPPYSTKDDISWIVNQETELYGVPITVNKIDACRDGNLATHTCREFNSGVKGPFILAGEIIAARPFKVKSGKYEGQEMGFMTLEDGTDATECVLFTESWEEYQHIIEEGNTVLVSGDRSYRGDSLQVKKVEEI